ncbi:MAG TPA: hypothetical protein PKX71_06260, partial [Candidatus Avimonas sp.]|nr:hypothetical protein [Candidatus Avimonas sp.]HQA16543.1 hypothetical protein [Candidatus Avimonas sp.]
SKNLPRFSLTLKGKQSNIKVTVELPAGWRLRCAVGFLAYFLCVRNGLSKVNIFCLLHCGEAVLAAPNFNSIPIKRFLMGFMVLTANRYQVCARLKWRIICVNRKQENIRLQRCTAAAAQRRRKFGKARQPEMGYKVRRE